MAERNKRALTAALQRAGNQKAEGQTVNRWRQLAEALWAKALGGNVAAVRLIAEYCEGRPAALPRGSERGVGNLNFSGDDLARAAEEAERWEQSGLLDDEPASGGWG